MFDFLRNHGANINAPVPKKRGRSELALAVEYKDITIVKGLLCSGADVNSRPAEEHGRTAIQAAAGSYRPDMDMFELLLRSGADVNAPASRKGGITALGAAAQQGHFQMALVLLKAGADVNCEWNCWELDRWNFVL